MSWIFIVLAGLFKVGGVIFMKLSDGFTKLKPTLTFMAFLSLSFVFLTLSLKDIPISIGYGIWTGIGAAGSVLLGMYFFKELATANQAKSLPATRAWKRSTICRSTSPPPILPGNEGLTRMPTAYFGSFPQKAPTLLRFRMKNWSVHFI